MVCMIGTLSYCTLSYVLTTLCTKRHGTARHGTARHGTARHGTASHGTARQATGSHRPPQPKQQHANNITKAMSNKNSIRRQKQSLAQSKQSSIDENGRKSAATMSHVSVHKKNNLINGKVVKNKNTTSGAVTMTGGQRGRNNKNSSSSATSGAVTMTGGQRGRNNKNSSSSPAAAGGEAGAGKSQQLLLL